MSQAHYEAVRLSSDRPYTTGGGSRRSFLPFRMRPTQSPADVKVSSRFSHPNEDFAKQIMHEHILGMSINTHNFVFYLSNMIE
jgi:hypothetical protein